MIKIGTNTENWRHADKPVEYCLEAIAKLGIEYCESEAARGKSTGISASVVHIGEGVNAPNIAKGVSIHERKNDRRTGHAGYQRDRGGLPAATN